MKILNKLTIKNLLLNKKRTVVTIVGIILSVALICAVGGMLTSFRESAFQNEVVNGGYYHLKVNASNEETDNLKLNRDIRDIMTVKLIGYANLPKSQNKYKPYMYLYSMDEITFKNLHFNLKEGRFPENNKEVIISKAIITNARVNYKIGDKITLDMGYRYDSNGVINGGSYVICNKQDEECLDEFFKVETSEEVTIVGIMDRPSYSFEDYQEPGYTIITTNMKSDNNYAYLTLNNPYNYKQDISEILGDNNLYHVSSKKYQGVYINNDILRWEVFKFSDSTMNMLILICSVVITIIIITSVFCIRNSFGISIVEKTKMFGMLASIGATKKQIKKSVLIEGFFLGLIGIPLGILSGLLADFILIEILNKLVGNLFFDNMSGFVFNVSPIIIIFSIILSIITIYLSTIKAAKRASKVSPIEAIRNSNEIKIKAKKIKTPRIVQTLFKTGGVIAYKNLKRSRKKYRTTVISIVVSVTTFITMNAFIYYAFRLSNVYYKNYNYDLIIYPKEENFNIEAITSLDDVKEYSILYQADDTLEVHDLSKVSSFGHELLIDEKKCTYNEKNDEYKCENQDMLYQTIIGLDDNSFRKFVKNANLNYDNVKDKVILNDYYLEATNNGKMFEKRVYEYHVGDRIKGYYKDHNYSLTIGGVTENKPDGFEERVYRQGLFFVNIDYYKELKFKTSFITISSDNVDNLTYEIEKLNLEINMNNYKEKAKNEESMVLVSSIFLYGFITVISLIGVTNIFNTITSNIKLRQKEFAVFKSIGMTKKEFNHMINLETIFYSFKSLTYGIIFGLLGSYLVYRAFASNYDSGFVISYKVILISIAVVIILVFTIMRYSMAKISKQNIIETIRNENI